MNSTSTVTTMSSYDFDTGDTTLNVPLMDPSQRLRSALGFAAAAARRRFPQSGGRIDAAARIILDGKVVLHHDRTASVQSEKSDTVYRVNGHCECPDAARAPENWCKHRLAAAIAKKALLLVEEWLATQGPVIVPPQVIEADEAPEAVPDVPEMPVVKPVTTLDDTPGQAAVQMPSCPECEGAVAGHSEPEAPDQTIPTQFLYRAKGGKVAVYYAGLLDLAHRQGLIDLNAEFISVTADVALAKATATFRDGRTFTEAADATPSNVGKTIAPHFARMALTRAKARALRDALNINLVSVEELE